MWAQVVFLGASVMMSILQGRVVSKRSLAWWLAAAVAWVAVIGVALPRAGAQQVDELLAARALQKAMVDAIARAERSVVAIARVRRRQQSRDSIGSLSKGILDADALGLPERKPTDPEFVPNEFATGVVIDSEGHVLTNYHVLGNPDDNDYYVWVQRKPFKVTRVETPLRVEAGDPWTDLAVLTIAAKNELAPIQFGDATKLKKGMIVIALGNPYAIARDGSVSATWGIIANLQRSAPLHAGAASAEAERDSLHHFGTLIQTDAHLQAGTSGGALVDLQGKMVGLTTSLAPLAGYEQAAGFAIPVNSAFRKIINVLKQGRVPEYGFLGVEPENLSLSERRIGMLGARVLRVLPGTPADKANLRPDDVITQVNGLAVADRDSLFCELSQLTADSRVELVFDRRDPASGQRRVQMTQVVLTKKYTPTLRKPFAQVQPRTWRGLRVEYPSALPPRFRTLGLSGGDPKGCVAVLAVDRDSPTWKAGLRAGQYISHVGNRRVETPREFYDTVDQLSGVVRLHLITGTGSKEMREVAP